MKQIKNQGDEEQNPSGERVESPLNAQGWRPAALHILLTPETCDISHDDRQCPVCDGGLAVCANCGKYEAGLDDPICRPKA